MNTTTIDLSEFSSETPTERGMYLYYGALGVRNYTVIHIPSKVGFGGLGWHAYYGVKELNNSNVGNFKGKWLKVEIEGFVGEFHNKGSGTYYD